MKRTIIVTDLTRFQDNRVCLAGVDQNNMELIRPMPYINQNECQLCNILPGTRITADFREISPQTPPHIEDYMWRNKHICGSATSKEFQDLLVSTLSGSIRTGFGVPVQDKIIPQENVPLRSIITVICSVRLHPGYGGDLSKIRASITDSEGLTLQYLSIADLGFYRYAQKLRSQQSLKVLEDFIMNQNIIFLRLGLSRFWESQDGRKGFWIQINGIYTFPDFSKEIRSYE